jgi:F0F1-type ATP synthase membrane subunit b/b'
VLSTIQLRENNRKLRAANERLQAEIEQLRNELRKAYAQLYPASHTGRILDRSVDKKDMKWTA